MHKMFFCNFPCLNVIKLFLAVQSSVVDPFALVQSLLISGEKALLPRLNFCKKIVRAKDTSLLQQSINDGGSFFITLSIF